MFRHIEDGTYIPTDELENLKEEKTLLELLHTELLYDGFHDFIKVRVRGNLPDTSYLRNHFLHLDYEIR